MSRKMKDSGIEWIGEIPEDWEIVRYKEICDIKNGYPFDSKLFSVNEGFPLIRIRDITSGQIETYYNGDYEDSYIVRKYDIIVGMDGDFNIRRWDNEDALLNQRCMKIISNNNISDGIIYYQLPFQLKIINDLTYATTVKHLSHYDVLNSKLVLPDNPEQQHKIANFLDKKVAEIDHILEKTRESIEEYKKYKQSIITEAVTKGLNPDVKMKDSGIEWIGEIPEHWIYGRIKYNTYLKGRIGWQGLKADEFIDEGPYLVTGIHFGNDEVDWDKCYHISAERYNEAPEIHLRVGDLLITKDGTIGKLAYIWCLPEEATLNSHLLLIRPTSKLYDNKFMLWILKSRVFIEYYSYYKYGSIMDSISQEQFKDFNFYCPPTIEEQDLIVNFLKPKCTEIDNLIAKKENLLADLEAYKKSLIYECVTGKREVV